MDKPCACPPKCARTARLSRPFRGAVTAIRENGAASGAGVLAEFEYDNLGRRIALHRADNAGVSTVYAYDAASRLSSLQQDLSGTANDPNFSFTYNAAGQAVSRTSNAAYDWPQPSISAASYTPNGRNQYTTVGGGAFTYDARGNLTATGAATYGYDAFNRLTSAGSATLSYDPAGRLHQTTSNGSTVTARFLYDGVDAIAEYDSSNVMQRRYVHGPGMDEPLVEYVGSGTSDRRWLVTDQLGSVVAATNASGAQIGSANTYDEYGVPAATNSGRFQYTGQMWIGEAGLYHYKARAYVPTIGRFAQSDPILYAGGMNIYGYVGNDPVNFVDPLGLQDEGTITVTGNPCPQGWTCRDAADGGFRTDALGGTRGANNARSEAIRENNERLRRIPLEDDDIVVVAEPDIDWKQWLLRGATGLSRLTAAWVFYDIAIRPTELGIDDCRALPSGCVTTSSGQRSRNGTTAAPAPTPTDEECEAEWADARAMCARELSSSRPNRAITGGYRTIEQCARGIVSQACGGNMVDPRR